MFDKFIATGIKFTTDKPFITTIVTFFKRIDTVTFNKASNKNIVP